MSSTRNLAIPTPEEDVAINAGIAADPDTFEPGEAHFKQLKRMGRPRKALPEVSLTVRSSAGQKKSRLS